MLLWQRHRKGYAEPWANHNQAIKSLQMSFATTFNVFQDQRLTAGQTLVLAGISTFASDTGKCWPSIATIAARCKITGRSVQRHISKLVKLGYLTRIYRKGRSAITKISTELLEHYAQAGNAAYSPREASNIVGDTATKATGAGEATRSMANTDAPTIASPQAEQSRRDTASLGEVIQGWRATDRVLTHDSLSPLPTTACHPESVIESVNETTAQPSAPEVAESPAIAAVVVFESADTKARPAVDLVEDDPLAEVPAALLADFGIVRKAKKKAATVTKTEAVVFAAEAAKAGLTPAQAVEACIHRGWSRFEAAWLPQAPAMPVQRVYVPEVAPPASPDVIAAHRAALLAAKQIVKSQAGDGLEWARAHIENHAAGKHVSGFALRSARAALRL